ncbi:hypothetical protein [Dactylosporangium roseum]|uniref:hypothetical protein n=1 Tax=Dactylosporangium roseum TaxID=47989 RepID=UPI0031DE474A
MTVTFYDDDRIIEAGDGPAHLYLAMSLRCKAMGTDGRLMESQIGRLGRPRWKAELAKLATLRLVVRDEITDEWCIAAWFAHNDSMEEIDTKRAADRDRKAAKAAERRQQEADSGSDSERNPSGKVPDSALKGREGKGKEGKEREGNPLHRFAADDSGSCGTCHLPAASRFHLHVVEEAS